MSNKEYLKHLIKKCEEVFGRNSFSQWKNSDYVDLSFEIHKATKVKISPNTLKRIFGKINTDNDYTPQKATIEAMRIYCNDDTENSTTNGAKSINYKKILLITLILSAIAIFILYALKWNQKLEGKITVVKQDGQLPATVYFNLELPKTNEKIFIDFGDESGLRPIKKDQFNIGHNYLFPGVFETKLIANNKTISSENVTILSDHWVVLAFNQQKDIPNSFYQSPAVKNKNNSTFHVSNKELFQMGIDTANTFYTRLCNYTTTNYKLEDFIFESSFKNQINEAGIYCNGVQFQISGEKHCIRFKLVNNGCSYRIRNIISEKEYIGLLNDLSDFTLDLSKLNAVKIINENKNVKLFVNEQLIFEESYQESLGEIKGVFIEFEGNGYVNTCSLSSKEGEYLLEF